MVETTEAIETVKRRNKERHPYGVSCRFIPFNADWGIKVFESETERDRAVYWQRKAAEVGLGPKVGVVFEIKNLEHHVYDVSHTVYCHVTERVDMSRQKGLSTVDGSHQHMIKQIRTLRRLLRAKIGFNFEDDHHNNVGYLNGHLVCIDFDAHISTAFEG